MSGKVISIRQGFCIYLGYLLIKRFFELLMASKEASKVLLFGLKFNLRVMPKKVIDMFIVWQGSF